MLGSGDTLWGTCVPALQRTFLEGSASLVLLHCPLRSLAQSKSKRYHRGNKKGKRGNHSQNLTEDKVAFYTDFF